MLPKSLAFVDIETTGFSLKRDRVIEIGIIKLGGDGKDLKSYQVVQTFNSLINPGFPLDQEALALTNISSMELENAPSFYSVKNDLLELFEESWFVAHNVRFDYSFLKQEFSRFDQSFSPKQLCTLKLSRLLFPEFKDHNLDSLIERLDLVCLNRHRAFDDSAVLYQFFQKISQTFSLERIIEAFNKIQKTPTVPINISKDDLDVLPEGPGVYIFYGQNGSVLYVGKSLSIRKRVLSHFSSDSESSKEMKIAQQVVRIETIETAGELGALILESSLVKKLQPLFNSKLRYSREMVVLKACQNKDQYQEVSLETIGEIDPSDLEQIVGVFRSRRQAKEFLANLAREHDLCEKLLGLEKTKGECFNYRLGKCQGACKLKEKPLKYNLRFLEAFSSSKIKRWPFSGPVLIKEEDPLTGKGEAFLVDNWCYLGSVKSDSEHREGNLEASLKFDLDVYKILKTYIFSDKNSASIEILSPKNIPQYL